MPRGGEHAASLGTKSTIDADRAAISRIIACTLGSLEYGLASTFPAENIW